MDQLDVEDGFDVHEYRHGLKLLQQDRATMHLSNRNDFHCPACGEVFDDLFVSERRENTFGNPDDPICIVRTDDRILLLTH